MRRVLEQPAFLLHQRPFRDTSQLLDVLSREHGRIALVARGSRSARSRLRGLLRPFLPLKVSWVMRADLGTLTGAEVDGAPLALGGDALWSGYYMNELLVRFLHRQDPHPEVFDAYRKTIAALPRGASPAAPLRAFEIALLRELGYALDLEFEARTQAPLEPSRRYEYRVEQGPVAVERSEGPLNFSGDELLSIVAERFDDPAVLGAAGRLLREVIGHHLGGRELMSRKVLRELHRGRLAGTRNPEGND